MRTKRFLSILLSLVLVLGMLPGMSLTASAAGNTTEITPTNTSGTMTITLTIQSNTCTVTYDPETHTLTVTGSGAMANYSESNPAPWASYNDSVTSVVISDGVTGIGEDAFCNFSALTSLSMADTVTSIGEAAFLGCGSLKDITIPASVTSIGDRAFYNFSFYTTATFIRPESQSTLTIGNWVFMPDTALYYSGDSKYALFDDYGEIELSGVPEEGDYNHPLNSKDLTWKELQPYAVTAESVNGTVTASVNGEVINDAYQLN